MSKLSTSEGLIADHIPRPQRLNLCSAAHPRPPSSSLYSLRRALPPSQPDKASEPREAATPGLTNVPSGLGCPPVP
eukprot:4630773-Prymnesium_polylepis.1